MRKTEVPEGNWILGCSPDHSTIRPKILSLKSQPSLSQSLSQVSAKSQPSLSQVSAKSQPSLSQVSAKSERLASRRKVVSSGFHSLVVLVFFCWYWAFWPYILSRIVVILKNLIGLKFVQSYSHINNIKGDLPLFPLISVVNLDIPRNKENVIFS